MFSSRLPPMDYLDRIREREREKERDRQREEREKCRDAEQWWDGFIVASFFAVIFITVCHLGGWLFGR